jgi:hypothetical protein
MGLRREAKGFAVRLAYQPYFLSEGTLFFFYNKLVNNNLSWLFSQADFIHPHQIPLFQPPPTVPGKPKHDMSQW